MIEEQDFQIIERRLDQRYKQIRDCNDEMDEVKKEHTQIYVDIASIKKIVESLQWVTRTTLGALIAGIIGIIIAIVK